MLPCLNFSQDCLFARGDLNKLVVCVGELDDKVDEKIQKPIEFLAIGEHCQDSIPVVDRKFEVRSRSWEIWIEVIDIARCIPGIEVITPGCDLSHAVKENYYGVMIFFPLVIVHLFIKGEE